MNIFLYCRWSFKLLLRAATPGARGIFVKEKINSFLGKKAFCKSCAMQHFITSVYQKCWSILPTKKLQTVCINEGATSPWRVTALLCKLLCCLGLMYHHRTIGYLWLERSSSPTHSSNARQQYELRTLEILKSSQRHCTSAMSWKGLSFCDYTGPDGLWLSLWHGEQWGPGLYFALLWSHSTAKEKSCLLDSWTPFSYMILKQLT